ncbi:MAG: branched-chain amino acid ABC transporter permease [Xanthobacteraceae bacterium]|uniref:branched-chain amino acid ABC transporter permease n=1 Tax=Pseudolabrys sp. TaxID=1960880 RepID=UPI003D147788
MAASDTKNPVAPADARARAAAYLFHRHNFRWPEALPWLIAIGCFFVFPERMTFGNQMLVMIMFALSLDLILGYAGIVTLGHAAFFGIGAYTVALGSLQLGWSEPISGLVAAGILAGLVGAVVGWFILRYRGLTLLMLTIAFAAMLQESGNLRSDITGGYDGLPGLMFDPLLGTFQYDLYGHTNFIYVLVVLALVFFVVRRIVYSPFGQALTGIRENVRRMHAIGSPVHRRLVTAYAISAAIAGIAGALFTQTNAYVTLTVFDFENSAKVMVMLILGGTGRLYGAFLGGAVYMILEDEFSKLSPTFWQLGVGLLLVCAVLFARRGLIGLADDVRWLFGAGKAREREGEGSRRFVWRPEHWKELGWSALDGAILGFIAGFAVNVKFIEFLSTFVTSMPARALVFTLGGAAIGMAINLIYLFSTSRTAVEAKAS